MDNTGFHRGMKGWNVIEKEEAPRGEFFIGVSLGRHNQRTTIVIIKRKEADGELSYTLGQAERFSPEATYPEIAKRLDEIWGNLQRENDGHIILDVTEVGEPVRKFFRDQGIEIKAEIVITQGFVVTQDEKNSKKWSVPKRDLVGAIEILLQTDRLEIAEGIPDSSLIKKELLEFSSSNQKADSIDDGISGREGVNDDYIFAAAVAVWYSERRGGIPVCPLPSMERNPRHTDFSRMYPGFSH